MATIKNLYFTRNPSEWGFNTNNIEIIEKHNVGMFNGVRIIYPEVLDESHINPKTITQLKNRLKIESVIFVDATKNTEGLIAIKDHVNRSGLNFLRGVTPFENRPRFPDLSHIYMDVDGLQKATVHTIGRTGLENEKDENIAWSEAAGFSTPVLYYCGLSVRGIGGEINKKNIQALHNIINFL